MFFTSVMTGDMDSSFEVSALDRILPGYFFPDVIGVGFFLQFTQKHEEDTTKQVQNAKCIQQSP